LVVAGYDELPENFHKFAKQKSVNMQDISSKMCQMPPPSTTEHQEENYKKRKTVDQDLEDRLNQLRQDSESLPKRKMRPFIR
jgi:hypothetical protein